MLILKIESYLLNLSQSSLNKLPEVHSPVLTTYCHHHLAIWTHHTDIDLIQVLDA